MYVLVMHSGECIRLGERSAAFTDVYMDLLYLPSLMSTGALDNFTMATEVFIESKMSLYTIPIEDVKVQVSSQTLDRQQAFGELFFSHH